MLGDGENADNQAEKAEKWKTVNPDRRTGACGARNLQSSVSYPELN
jgi:hypothetical protein